MLNLQSTTSKRCSAVLRCHGDNNFNSRNGQLARSTAMKSLERSITFGESGSVHKIS